MMQGDVFFSAPAETGRKLSWRSGDRLRQRGNNRDKTHYQLCHDLDKLQTWMSV